MRKKRRPVPVHGLLHPGAGPVLKVEVHGASSFIRGIAVLDTGASMSVVDRGIAAQLGLASPGAAEWSGVTDSGKRSHAALRTGRIQIPGDDRLWELDLVEVPALVETVPGMRVVVLLGWDFLTACRLTCDGPAGAFELLLPR